MSEIHHLRAHEYLGDQKHSIFEKWIARTRADNSSQRLRDPLLIVNSLPVLIDRLIDALNPAINADRQVEHDLLSAHHGLQRAHAGHYTIDQVIEEYGTLQEIILESFEDWGRLPTKSLATIARYFLTATRVAASSFADETRLLSEQSEIQFKRLVQDAKDVAIFIISPEGLIRTWNDGAHRIKQFSADEAIGNHYRMLFREEDRIDGRPERNLKIALEGGRHEEQWWRIKKDGTIWWAEAILSTFYSPTGKLLGIAKIVRDLTEKRRSDERLRDAMTEAEAASKLKTTFVANMSHEIRTPLGAILGFSKFLGDPNISDEARDESLKVIDRNGKALLRIISDILDMAKVEAGKLDIENREIPLRVMLPEVTAMFEIKAREKGLTLDLAIDESTPEYITTDSVRLRQIIGNLLSNAVKFTVHGGIKVVATLDEANGKNGFALIVSDTGHGIPSDKRTRIFGEFNQADASVTRRFGGSGLGLALSRNLARALGGDIELLESSYGGGCVFRLKIANRKKVEKTSSQTFQITQWKKAETEKRSFPLLANSQILIVEDSADSRLLIKRILEPYGAIISFAENGDSGVTLALRKPYDVVLMDTQMPIMDGIEATTQLRASNYLGTIISLSAHAMKEDRLRSLEAGSSDYITKPIDADELLNLIESWLARTQK